jgi:hypothetical protein
MLYAIAAVALIAFLLDYRERLVTDHKRRMNAFKDLMIDSFRVAAKICENSPVTAAVFLNLQAETLENDLTDEAVEKAKKIINS